MTVEVEDMDMDELRDEVHDLRNEISGYRNGSTQQAALMMAAGCVHELQEEVDDLRKQLEVITFERDVLKANQILTFGA